MSKKYDRKHLALSSSNCLMEWAFNFAKYADDTYHDLLVSSCDGINQTPDDIAMIDTMIFPLLKRPVYRTHLRKPCLRDTLL